MESKFSDTLYRIQDIPNKGLGFIAATKIAKGTRILPEPPSIRVPQYGVSKERCRDSIVRSVAALCKDDRDSFFSLHNAFQNDKNKELNIVCTNALPLGSDATSGGIFLQASRINHSCRSNAQNSWNENLGKLTIHAVRDIEENEEITICYLHTRTNRQSRQNILQQQFGFLCSCELCSLPPDQRKSSDERLENIQQLDCEIGDSMLVFSSPLKALHNAHQILALLEKEKIEDGSIPRAYYDAFQIAITHGDQARAKTFAERATKYRIILEGLDSPTVHHLNGLSEDPTRHGAYGCSDKWKTQKNGVPKDLESAALEEWLWRIQPESQSQSQYASFRNDVAFPPFRDLPHENEIDLDYFETTDGFMYKPRKHWCFLGEIVEFSHFMRLMLTVKDKNSQTLPVAFYTNARGGELDLSQIQVGSTVAILYAEQHYLLDMSIGVRHETPYVLKVFPASLKDLFSLSDKVNKYAAENNGLRTCNGCDQTGASMKKCARCNMFWYCNKSCQQTGWKEKGHKSDCKLLKDSDLRGLLDLDWDEFDDMCRFPLSAGGN